MLFDVIQILSKIYNLYICIKKWDHTRYSESSTKYLLQDPFSMLLMKINTTLIFQHWKREEGMLILTVVSTYVVEDSRFILKNKRGSRGVAHVALSPRRSVE